jgi:hypothetical protein
MKSAGSCAGGVGPEVHVGERIAIADRGMGGNVS